MKIENISIENFRAVRFGLVEFDPGLTILIGRNGSGKTSVLEAIARCLKTALLQFRIETPFYNGGVIRPDELRIGAADAKITLALCFDEAPPDRQLQVVVVKSDVNSPGVPGSQLPGLYGVELNPTLPVYYRQDRSFSRGSGMETGSRTHVWATSIDGNFQILDDLNKWWDRLDAREARQVRDRNEPDYRDPQLEAVREAVRQIEGFSRIFYASDKNPPGLFLEKSNGISVSLGQLSSGELSYISLIADLARRLQTVQPEKPLSEIDGIVLIDEIELNLHPAWQSQITPTLRKIFPACQFVISTHSPQVVSGVESHHVRILEISAEGNLSSETPRSTKGRTSDYLLEGVFKASERDPVVDNLIGEFNDAVDADDFQRAEALLTRIKDSIDGDPPEIVILKKRLRRIEKSQ